MFTPEFLGLRDYLAQSILASLKAPRACRRHSVRARRWFFPRIASDTAATLRVLFTAPKSRLPSASSTCARSSDFVRMHALLPNHHDLAVLRGRREWCPTKYPRSAGWAEKYGERQ